MMDRYMTDINTEECKWKQSEHVSSDGMKKGDKKTQMSLQNETWLLWIPVSHTAGMDRADTRGKAIKCLTQEGHPSV